MIRCVSAVCCISHENSEKFVLLTPPLIWIFTGVFIATSSIKTYTEYKTDHTNSDSYFISLIFFIFGIGSILESIFSLSNVLQVIFELPTAHYAMKLQRYGQTMILFFFLFCVTIEISIYSSIENEHLLLNFRHHLIKVVIATGILIPFTIISHLCPS